jgi:hypothetical protein
LGKSSSDFFYSLIEGRWEADRKIGVGQGDFSSETASKAFLQFKVLSMPKHLSFSKPRYWAGVPYSLKVELKSHFIDLNVNTFYIEAESDYSLFGEMKEPVYCQCRHGSE